MNPVIRHFRERLSHMPWMLMLLIMLIASSGFLVLYSAAGENIYRWAMPQAIRFAAGFGLMLTIALTPLRLWMRYAYVAYGVTLVLLIAVEVIGHIGMGAQRWIDLGVIKLQPSELSKITIILAVARYFHAIPPMKYSQLHYLIAPLIMILVPVALILKQPNLGTATLLSGIVVWMMFAAGLPRRYFAYALLALAVATPIAWQSLHDYQKQRVMTFMNPEADPLGSGYNISQSIIAIGSGGIAGKGLGKGSQTQLNFLPEKQTDFVFTVLAEEFGFIGGAALILAYTLMILWIIGIAYHSASLFGGLIAHGVAAMLCLHLFINVGMVMGLMPVVGIPLPLLSYGGSIMISILAALGLAMNVWINRNERLSTTHA